MNTKTIGGHLNVVALDGPRGVGKSRLGSELRNYFGCHVLELGPLFRLIAWFIKHGHASDFKEGCKILNNSLDVGRLRIRTDVSGKLAASRIEIDGESIEQELWHTELDELVKSVAESKYVIDCIAQVAHQLVGQPTVVIGREVGCTFFPEAPLKIVLLAHHTSRRSRKRSQLSQEALTIPQTYSVERSEPSRTWEYSGDTLAIDTTNRSPEEVLQLVAERIVLELGWVVISNCEEAHAYR